MKIKIGDSITARTWSGEDRSGIISRIEICQLGSKSGRPVKSAETTKHDNGVVIFGGYWCYFCELLTVTPNTKKK